MQWIATKKEMPPKGKIAIWFDDDIFSANVLENDIVDCPVLELTWDLQFDPSHEWFTHWQRVVPPVVDG